MSNFDFLDNLPLLVFSSIFLVLAVILIRGAIILLKADNNVEKEIKGSKILSNSLYGFSALAIVVLIFLLVSYILNKGEVILPHSSSEEFPVSPSVNFPPPPEFITIEGRCFEGPFRLTENQSFIENSAIYAILCKKETEYDIIYIGETKGGQGLLNNEQHKCWIEKCEQADKNLYSAIFSTSLDKYSDEERLSIKQSLEMEINPVCPVLE